MKIIAVIPARYESQRLPGKAMIRIAGKPMIVHVYERVIMSKELDAVIVATDDERIANAIRDAGGQVEMTSHKHQSGTDRIAEVIGRVPADLIVNVQGDEPMFNPRMIENALAPFHRYPELQFGTLRAKIRQTNDIFDPNCVKVVVDRDDFALYFSRAPIPFARGLMSLGGSRPELSGPQTERPAYYKHLGLYVYRRDFLLEYAQWPQTALEKAEKLEQLRAMEHGTRIICPLTEYDTISVDTPTDLARVKSIIEDGH